MACIVFEIPVKSIIDFYTSYRSLMPPLFFYIFVFLGLLLWNTFVYTTNLDKYLFFPLLKRKKSGSRIFFDTEEYFKCKGRGVIKDWCSLHPFFGFYQILNFRCFEIKLKAENLDETSNCGSTWNFEFFKSYFAIASFMDRDKKQILLLFIILPSHFL